MSEHYSGILLICTNKEKLVCNTKPPKNNAVQSRKNTYGPM